MPLKGSSVFANEKCIVKTQEQPGSFKINDCEQRDLQANVIKHRKEVDFVAKLSYLFKNKNTDNINQWANQIT